MFAIQHSWVARLRSVCHRCYQLLTQHGQHAVFSLSSREVMVPFLSEAQYQYFPIVATFVAGRDEIVRPPIAGASPSCQAMLSSSSRTCTWRERSLSNAVLRVCQSNKSCCLEEQTEINKAATALILGVSSLALRVLYSYILTTLRSSTTLPLPGRLAPPCENDLYRLTGSGLGARWHRQVACMLPSFGSGICSSKA